ncbi:hypothetical protein M1466_03910 [Candidatus Dependentiae bacterium]|nr:hypothetical protein [Candidatus Dependentiae bacterium]
MNYRQFCIAIFILITIPLPMAAMHSGLAIAIPQDWDYEDSIQAPITVPGLLGDCMSEAVPDDNVITYNNLLWVRNWDQKTNKPILSTFQPLQLVGLIRTNGTITLAALQSNVLMEFNQEKVVALWTSSTNTQECKVARLQDLFIAQKYVTQEITWKQESSQRSYHLYTNDHTPYSLQQAPRTP